jgi:hypothetical protein
VRSFLNHPQFDKNKSGLQLKKAFCVGVKSKTILTDAGFEVVAFAFEARPVFPAFTTEDVNNCVVDPFKCERF